MPEVQINGRMVAGYLTLPEGGRLDHDDASPPQVGANGVSAQVLARRYDPAKVELPASDDEPAVLVFARPGYERPA